MGGDGDECSLERCSRETAKEGDDIAFCIDGDEGDVARKGTRTLALQHGDENAAAFQRGGASAPAEAHGSASLSTKRQPTIGFGILQCHCGASEGGGQITRLQPASAYIYSSPSGVSSA